MHINNVLHHPINADLVHTNCANIAELSTLMQMKDSRISVVKTEHETAAVV